jgi:putative acetyltransferase
MHAVLAAADALDAPAVGLLGDPGYYRRFGSELAEPMGVHPPQPEWTKHFQIRRLTALF